MQRIEGQLRWLQAPENIDISTRSIVVNHPVVPLEVGDGFGQGRSGAATPADEHIAVGVEARAPPATRPTTAPVRSVTLAWRSALTTVGPGDPRNRTIILGPRLRTTRSVAVPSAGDAG